MFLKNIYLNNFRNYSDQHIEFSGKLNYIYGSNGTGKTNILESISFITFGKSFVNSPEIDCLRFGEGEFNVSGNFESSLGNEFSVSLNYNSAVRKKLFYLNKERVPGFTSAVFGKFPIVFMTPHSLEITYGNPSERRRFFDITLSQISRIYLDYLRNINRLLKLKNILLKSYSSGGKITGFEFNNLLESYNDKLAEMASEITVRRNVFVKDFLPYLEKNFRYLISSNDTPFMEYQTCLNGKAEGIGISYEKENLFSEYRRKLEEFKNEEIARATCIIGTHRDDYIFKLKKQNENNKPFLLKNFCSQGEHKTYLVGLKLAEYEYIKDRSGVEPILLLDDILSELDSDRVEKIISHLNEFGQVFITSTESGYLGRLKQKVDGRDISVFKIENSKVIIR
ncbi:MAG: DNA replication/repair protein RecF [Ignavibacteria bacterium]|nr:DNA replication/repair protein RecF [Ignavibacteria bacterium]